jgi:hypothetical protein
MRYFVAHDETKKIHQQDYIAEGCNIGEIAPGDIEIVSSVQEARLARLYELEYTDCEVCVGP